MTPGQRAIWWHVYPLGFLGAEPRLADLRAGTRHRLRRLTDWLDYVVELGLDGLALGPVFRSATHGYDTLDHYAVDPRLGDRADLDALIAAAHARGIAVMLDGVFNHVGREHPLIRRALAAGPAEGGLLRWSDDGEPEVFEGHASLVALNHDEPAVAELVADVMRHWLRAGADGWRLDAAYAVPVDFWRRVLPAVRAEFPDAYVLGEVIHGDYAGMVAETGMDAVTQYELWKAIWSSLNDVNFFELAHALRRHAAMVEVFAPYTFVGNHDVTRIATRLDDRRHLAHALVVLLTVGGTPSVYYGDEQGLEGTKEDRPGGDDAVRPAFPGSPADLRGWEVHALHRELIALRRRHPWLHRATTRELHLTNATFAYEVSGGGARLVVVLNLLDHAVAVPTDGATALEAGAVEVLAGGRARVPAHGWAVLR